MAARVGTLGGVRIRLADWLEPEARYRHALIPVDPESETVSGDRPGLSANPAFRSFAVRSWRGGEGKTTWERESRQYRSSTNVRPVSIQDGLILGARQIVTPPAGGGTFSDGSRFGYGLGQLWTGDDGSGYPWDPTNDEWDAGVSTGAGTSDFTSMTDGDDTWIYSGHESGAIWRWKTGSAENHYATGTFSNPLLRSFGGVLYALDGDDLYEIDKVTANTRTIRADVSGSSAVYRASTPWAYGRMSLSDRGPIWLQRLDNGQTFLWLYDPASDTQERLGKISVDFVFPYSVFFSHGFVFVGLRYAPAHSEPGDAYLWFKRGAQDGYAGPFRSQTESTGSKPILIAGVIGDDLIVYFDGAVWAYNLTDGAIYQMADQTTTGTPEDAITFGKEIFITPVTSGGNSLAVERFDTTAYTTEVASIDLGKHDWDYPGMVKTLLDVSVVTDPLPADTTLQVAVSADGAAFATLTGTASTDGATRHTFTASTSAGTTISGMEFEIRLLPLTTNVANTVTVREVSGRATGAEHVLETVMILDASGDDAGLNSEEFIAALKALAQPASPAVVAFTDTFQLRESESATAYDVTVEEVVTPEIMDDHVSTPVAAQVRVRGVSLV
jgi:hypothetical protein